MKHIYPRLLNKFHLLPKMNIYETIYLNSLPIKIPILKKVGLTNLFIAEEWMLNLLKLLLSVKEGCFIDVGTNIGQTLIKLRSLDKELEYIGFEPNPVCVNYVMELIKANGFVNCKIIPAGLSHSASILELNLYEDDIDQSATIIENFRPTKKVFRKSYVPVFTYQTLKENINIGKPGIIKIDVEGAELEVIEGLVTTLRNDKPFVICEILPAYFGENLSRISRQEKIFEILRDCNYHIFRINGNHLHELRKIEVHADLALTNYLFIPQENSREIQSLLPSHRS